MPPTGSTRPDSVISPVIATSPRTGRPVSSDAIAAAIVTPADGPSFGMAPDGTCTCISALLKKSGSMPYSRAWVRSHDSAARADSFMTSPSCPVSVSDPVPAMRDASMKSTSPPTGVQARPMATPGSLVRSSISSSRNLGAPSSSHDDFGRDGDRRLVAFRAPPRGLAAERADFALEIPDAGLARVAANDLAQRVGREA